MKRGLGIGGWGLVVLALSASAPLAQAQDRRLQFTVGGTLGQEIVQSHVDDVHDRLSGLMLGVEGVLISDRLMVRVRYSEGRITPRDESTAEPRDVVNGEALFGVRVMPWLSVWVGPSARAYTVGDSDQRWLIWSGRASARGTLLPGRMQSFVELWGALSGSVGSPSLKAGGRGANGGLEMRLGQRDFWGRLGYRIESTHASGMRETVETLTLSVVYGVPQ